MNVHPDALRSVLISHSWNFQSFNGLCCTGPSHSPREYVTRHRVCLLLEGHGVNQAIELAHKNIKEYAQTEGLGTDMGTTIVLLLSHGSLYNICWVGDSRAYLVDKEQMKQITVEHSLVQALIDQGELTREEAETDPRKNAVTRALGVQGLETVRADSISERW